MADKTTRRKIKGSVAITRAYLRIARILELDRISRIYLRELIDMVDCDGCAIILIDTDKAKILAERGFSKTFGELEFTTDVPAIDHVVNTKQVIFAIDIQSSAAADFIPYGCPIISLICVPIMVNDDVRGIIYLDSPKKNAFNKKDMEFTELLAREIATALAQSLQYSEAGHTFMRDELTGCFNRSQFDADIAADVTSAQKYEEQLSLLMVNIDWFQKFNDFHGHQKGDTLLKQVADVLVANIRAYNKIYRDGGGFAILMADTSKDEALSAARRLQKIIEQEQFNGEGKSQPNGKITVSIGVANFPSDADNSAQLIEAADLALYIAKESGRNQVGVFSK